MLKIHMLFEEVTLFCISMRCGLGGHKNAAPALAEAALLLFTLSIGF
jgi:hypothetical protein